MVTLTLILERTEQARIVPRSSRYRVNGCLCCAYNCDVLSTLFQWELRMAANSEQDALDSVAYLYLRELSEPRDNSLRLVIDEAVTQESDSVRAEGLDLPELAEILKDAKTIETIESCLTFELTWEHYGRIWSQRNASARVVTTTTRRLAAGFSVSIQSRISSTILREIRVVMPGSYSTT